MDSPGPHSAIFTVHGYIVAPRGSSPARAAQPGFDSPVWVNAPVTVDEIRAAFRHEPCLLCVLAKRRKEGTLHWLKKAAAHKNSKLRIKQETPEVEASIKETRR